VTDEAALVAAARDGDRAALDSLLRTHYDRVHAVCRRVLGSSRDADDAAQETMIKVVRSLHAFDGRSSVSTWIYRIATNTALDELRKQRRRPSLHVVADDERPEEVDEGAAARVEAVVDRRAIDEAVATLPEEFRVAVVLRDVGDLDYAEIAAVLDVPVGTVKSRIARGRSMLADRLGNQEPPSGRPTPAS
jgi:RNA polymerase sigma-70 factor (ECF subfamily)